MLTSPEFTKMLEAIRRGDYQGLIAWHPDRLARNMREAGEVIDMLDKLQIKDLLFATASYEDNANGKMMLGITFALSKQYSEHLSESVLRGYGRRIETSFATTCALIFRVIREIQDLPYYFPA
jgi:site-specific DNA recombinase